MTPKGDYIFVRKLEGKVTSLIIPPKYQYQAEDFHSGVVFNKGHKVHQVNIGDEVAYNKNHGTEIELDDDKFIIIRPTHIMAVK